jgi:hypothetical protein
MLTRCRPINRTNATISNLLFNSDFLPVDVYMFKVVTLHVIVDYDTDTETDVEVDNLQLKLEARPRIILSLVCLYQQVYSLIHALVECDCITGRFN